ncbi:hypothetical protein D9615_007553 [Tricholomella constricta]|uniref:Uncharacterized protein n=1 Tax=Tricholomella constricta TaxID=117010 RepID=A0A8H5H7N9_9AGAR|nr:hypothetical protein D9615_007553 [Tricholomella constricta]
MPGYVPPHRRAIGTTAPLPQVRPTYSPEAVAARFNVEHHKLHTLNGQDDGSLSAIAVYADSQPGYHARPSQLFCHSHLFMLEGSIGRDFPVFEGRLKRYVPLNFEFAGWIRIVDVVYFEPRSEELISMVKQKFQGKARYEELWSKSLDMQWAVVTFEKVEGRIDNPMV